MIRIVSVALPKSPTNLAQGDEVRQIITRITRQRPSEILHILQNDFCNTIGPQRIHPAWVAMFTFGCRADLALNYRRVRSGGTYFGARRKAAFSAQVSTKLSHPSSQASAQQRS